MITITIHLCIVKNKTIQYAENNTDYHKQHKTKHHSFGHTGLVNSLDSPAGGAVVGQLVGAVKTETEETNA